MFDIKGFLARAGTLTVARSGSATVARLAVEALGSGRGVAVVVADRDALAHMRALITLFTPELSVAKSAVLQPVWQQPWAVLPPFVHRGLNREGWASRLATLYALAQGRTRGLLLTADNLINRLPPLTYFEDQELRLRQHEEMSQELLLEQLVHWGYQRVPMVANAGDMARRGDILDIVPPGYEKAVRLEFFGNTIDELRVFDPVTQRSVGQLEELTLLPVSALRMDKAGQAKMRSRWARLFQKGLLTEFGQASLLRAVEQGDMRLLPGMAYDASTVLEEWLPKDCLWFLPSRQELGQSLEEATGQWQADLKEDTTETRLEQPFNLALRELGRSEGEDKVALLDGLPCIYSETLFSEPEPAGHETGEGGADQGGATCVELAERNYHSFYDLFPAHTDTDRPWQQLVAGLRAWTGKRRQVILAFATERGRQKFLKFAEQDNLFPAQRYDAQSRGLFTLVAPVHHGMELAWDNVLVLGEDILQPRAERNRAPSGAFRGLDNHEGLQAGDILVHRDYGIGRFGGLFHMEMGGVENDYLLLEYADKARLYLPVDRMNVVQRYKSVDSANPALDRLGGSNWSSSKEKARKAIEKIAEDLVEMYAWRKVAKGFTYSPLGEMYKDFEASFGFEETPDQARAIQEVLADMEKTVPMDRLVCGDVGFGKTEVALRAAFRAACDGRQVALLCPTTVLAEQHFQTFRSRLASFPLNVGLLSRFVPKAKQVETLKLAAKGQIDILIGTHRLLSDDVVLPNLGLLILDEEQRFGVRHKEKMKKMRKNVDALTLTATPIPRTLQLSMSGIRELSVIETAPPERKPVATAILRRDKNVLRQVLEREIERQGQVFWVHNRVQGLEGVAAYVRELVPGARVGMAHGQMGERELETAMHQFWQGELDVLVCTAIVESGLDFPMANTLVVDQAQMFGLGQLYQLRGRVGRSDRQAYALFVVSDEDKLPEVARERLRIILELDYLGAGFQVAMEDLRLRGAGNILGEAQSGQMTRVGLDLYLEMLEEAITRLKGEGEVLRVQTEMNLGLPAHIPESYIADGRERLKYYKILSSAADAGTRQDKELELRDRYGPLPVELQTFLAALAFKDRVNQLGAARADIYPDRVRVSWADGQKGMNPDALVALVMHHADRTRLFPPGGLEMRLDTTLALPVRLDEARQILASLSQGNAAVKS